ncbi:MAG: prolipoprotein diacylglyceryl transferase [Puniceicoccales bacterium]|jgi:phosphatidylglycerol:prolipoprotein diacylglycerol transferase|nr:prolipoprotein diacylglyceryl transferase [Puniceicoccales bacterium]
MSPYIVHDIDPFFVRFASESTIGGIHWYGVCYAISFIIALFMMNSYSKREKSPLSSDQNTLLLSYVIIGVIAGGRLGYMLMYNFNGLIHDPMSTFRIWEGGMASHGGFVGVAIAVWLFCKIHEMSILKVNDICSSVAPIGLLLGRIGNFINGELYGKIAYVPWAIIFPQSDPKALVVNEIPPRHPSQLYEGFAEGLLLFIYMQLRFWLSRGTAEGQLTGEFLIGYSIARIATEFYRETDVPMICGMSRGQFLSIFLFIIGVVLIFIARKRFRYFRRSHGMPMR